MMAAVMSLASAAPVAAAPARVFSCAIGGKTVAVTMAGDRLTYGYGTPAKPEMTISGDPNSGNIFWLTQRFAGIERQLRFQRGEYSYIVYSVAGNAAAGAAAISGLVVMQGLKTISDKSCAKHAAFSTAYDWEALPSDTEDYSIM